MSEVLRFDRFVVDATSVRPVPGCPGMIDVEGIAARAGVQDYPEHKSREYRPPEEVLSPESLATLKGVPLTIEHPEVDGGVVTSSNVRTLGHGWVLDVKPLPEQGLVGVLVRVATDDALDEIRSRRKVELSCAYRARYDATPGTAPDGTPYDGVQRLIRYNALALTGLARAGHIARLRLDAMQTITIKLRGRTLNVPVLWADALSAKATELREAREKGDRSDAGLPVEEITIKGQTLVLPASIVEQILAMLGGGGAPEAGPPADAAPTAPAPQNPADQLPRMDAAAVGKIVAAEVAKVQRRDAIVRKAAVVLGDVESPDEWAAAASAIARVDSDGKADAEALAEAARKGDPIATGRLLERLDSACEAFRETHSSGDLALAIDDQRRDTSRADAAPKPNRIGDARQRMLDRLSGKPKTSAAAAG